MKRDQLERICREVIKNPEEGVIEVLTETIIRKEDHLKSWLVQTIEESICDGYISVNMDDTQKEMLAVELMSETYIWGEFDNRISDIYADVESGLYPEIFEKQRVPIKFSDN